MTRRIAKFSPKNNPEFINELRKRVKLYFEENKLSRYGNTNLYIKSVFMLLLYFTPYFLMIFGVTTSPFLILMSWIFMGLGSAGVGMVMMHDANHGTYSKNQKVNWILSKSLYFLGGFPPTWRHQHNTLHHGFTNVDEHDEDIAPLGVLRFSPHKPLKRIHRFQHFYAWFFYGLMTISWITSKDFRQIKVYGKEGAPMDRENNNRKLFIDLTLSKVLYYIVLLVIPIIVLPIAWYWTVLMFLIMHFVSGFVLTAIFQTAHVVTSSQYPLPDDQGNMENNWAIHQLLTTADYSPRSKIFSWLIGGLNYQVEHHLFPNISHVHYKKLSPIVKRTAEEYHLPYYVNGNFVHAVSDHARMLKILGRHAVSA